MMKYISLLILLLSFSFPLFSTEKVNILGVEMEWDGYKVKESETDLDPYSTSFDDIGEGRFFQSEYPVDKERYFQTSCGWKTDIAVKSVRKAL